MTRMGDRARRDGQFLECDGGDGGLEAPRPGEFPQLPSKLRALVADEPGIEGAGPADEQASRSEPLATP